MCSLLVAVSDHLHNHRPHCCAPNVSSTAEILHLTVYAALTPTPSIYVGYPKIARDNINDSSLEVTSMQILNPAPDSIELAFTQRLYTNSSYHPTLYPFNASFYLLDNRDNPPFASIQTPELQAANGTTSNVELQRVNITHLEEFTRYVLLSLASEEFTIALRGNGDLKQGGLPRTSVSYDQNITMKGTPLLANHDSGILTVSSDRLQPPLRLFSPLFPRPQRDRSRRHKCPW